MFKSNMSKENSNSQQIKMSNQNAVKKDEEVYYIDHGNGLIEVGTDEDARKFGIPKSKWEALQKYDLERDPQFIEKLNRDTEEFYTTVLGETPEEKEERKKRNKTDEFWRQQHILKLKNIYYKEQNE